jgi:hypothetical protein
MEQAEGRREMRIEFWYEEPEGQSNLEDLEMEVS